MSPLLFRRLSDEVLGSRLASGEAAAFDELYRRYANRLAAYGAHLLGDAALGDDIAQSTMLKAYGALREGRVPTHLKSWLFRIAHNAAIDLVVRRRELPSANLPESPSAEREPFAGALVEALAALPERQRRVYLLREVHGLRIDETAAQLGLAAAQVEQSVFAARNRLAELLVFGDRLNCVAVQRLAAGPLDQPERRALKTHLRACSACRSALGLRARVLNVLPGGLGLDWLARVGPGLITGSAPAVAKVGVVVATATIAAGAPVAIEHGPHLRPRPQIGPPSTAVHRSAAHVHRTTTRPVVLAAAVVAPARQPISDRSVEHADASAGRTREPRPGHDGPSGSGSHNSGLSGDDATRSVARTSTDGGDDGSGSRTITATPPSIVTVTTTVSASSDSHDSGSGSGSGSSSGSGSDGPSGSDDGGAGGDGHGSMTSAVLPATQLPPADPSGD